MHKSCRWGEIGWLVGVLVIGALARLWAIGHDLPFVYYGDELHMMSRSLGFGTGDLNPHWFHKPALYMYIIFFEYGVYYVVGRIFGLFPNVDAFAVHYFRDPTVFALLGRLTSAFCGLGCVVVV